MKTDRDLAINFDEWLRLRLTELKLTNQGPRPKVGSEYQEIDEADALRIAMRAVRLYDESHPRPLQVTQKQAAEILGLSRVTIGKMVRTGQLRLNKCGMIPISQIDRALAGD
ncbi:helix-turn-helix domain-containing protein [Burkholderia ubonensis]|uniref:helix-turn-helix domain-containing protein n=1 Tax=Burkholderia ubonensis TaxID=101571 RepID=UPI000A88560B|nr:helix-turn-helix domain-containing protein [Burkholderia ubonensis]